jgi:hypothetical protein
MIPFIKRKKKKNKKEIFLPLQDLKILMVTLQLAVVVKKGMGILNLLNMRMEK